MEVAKGATVRGAIIRISVTMTAAVSLASSIAAKPYTLVAFNNENAVGVYDHGQSAWLPSVVVGAGPVGIATDALQRFAYVTNQRGNSVSIVLVANRTIAGTIELASGSEPMGIVVSPNALRAYVANFGSNSVSVINTSTNAVAATIPVGALPTSLAASPNGDRVFVANMGDNTISVIDATSNMVSSTIPVTLPDNPQPRPFAVAFVPGGSGRLIVANNNASVASVYDGTTYALLSTITLGAQPTALGVVATNKVYAVNSLDATLTVFDPFSGAIAASAIALPEGALTLGIAPNAQLASITAYPSSIAVINTANESVSVPIATSTPVRTPFTLGAFVTNPAFECSLDLNANGSVDNDDVAMVTRYLVGIRGSALTSGFASLNSALIEAQLAAFDLDADGDSLARATTDGILISRASRGIIGNPLTTNARNTTYVGPPPLRTATLILQWMLDAHGVDCLP